MSHLPRITALAAIAASSLAQADELTLDQQLIEWPLIVSEVVWERIVLHESGVPNNDRNTPW